MTARRAEWKVKLKLPDTHAKRVGGKLEESAQVHKFQIAIAQAPIGTGSTNTEVVVHPEGDAATEVPCHEDAEQPRLEVGARDERPRVGKSGGINVVPVLAHHLEESVEANTDWGKAGDRARKDRVRPYIFLGRRPQHDRRNLQESLVVFGKLESGVLEGLAEIVELGKINVAGTAGSAVLA